jgi:asparagine synthase (glutamine-hydrolysing)
MCGIVFAYTPAAPTTAATLAAMGTALRHRGPDDEGHLLWHPFDTSFGPPRLLAGADTPAEVLRSVTPWQPGGRLEEQPRLAAPLAMGHRRLAIVDLSPWGHQPMVRDARWHVVYNGEIYNHLELRAELEALGQRFLTHSDTEVLLAAIATWGPQAALARCNGMWAFALLDTERRAVLISRDRFGVKPLYVWRGEGGALLLASEIKALLQHPAVRGAPSPDACAAYLQRGPQAWRAETEFAGITRFPAGHFAEFSLDAPCALQPQAFWQRPPAADPAEPFSPARAQALCGRYAELLEDAVRLRLRADVRLGTALSGGLDSSSIAALVNTQLRARGRDEKQETFSSVYRGAGNPAVRSADESAFVARVVQQLGVRSNLVEPLASEVPRAHEHMVWALDTPPAGTLMSSWHTFALVARRGVVVTLDGQGADEQLAGYTRYVRNLLVHAPLGAALAESRALLGAMQGFGSAVGIGLGGALLRRVAGLGALHALAQRLRMGADPSPTLAEALASDFETHLQNLLLYADKTAMAWSVESRMPFMDYRLVEFLATVPPAYKIHGGWTKWLARQALRDHLPSEVAWRRDKMGWAVPEPAWFEGPQAPLAAWLAQQLQGSGFAQQVAASAGLAINQAPLPQRLRLLNLAVWHRLFFEEAGRPGRALGRGMPLMVAA